MPSKASEWWHARRAEGQYAAQLRKIARHIGEIIKGFDLNDHGDTTILSAALRRYAEMLTPWARSAARQMVAEVAARSNKQWRKIGSEMGQSFSDVLDGPDIGARFRQLQDEQVAYITSLPRDAAERIQSLVTQGVVEGKRFTEIVPEIRRGGEVSVSRANLIARTETGRVVSNVTQARAESVGSTQFIWRTMGDAQVRPSHRAVNGKVFDWNLPPTLDGLTGNPGTVPNCRCYAEPILSLDLASSPRSRFMAEAA